MPALKLATSAVLRRFSGRDCCCAARDFTHGARLQRVHARCKATPKSGVSHVVARQFHFDSSARRAHRARQRTSAYVARYSGSSDVSSNGMRSAIATSVCPRASATSARCPRPGTCAGRIASRSANTLPHRPDRPCASRSHPIRTAIARTESAASASFPYVREPNKRSDVPVPAFLRG